MAVIRGIRMSRTCENCGKSTTTGRKYTRRGLAKKKGGVGRKITGKSNRTFKPNLQNVKIRDANGTIRTARLCAKCLRTGVKKGTVVKAVKGSRKQFQKPAVPEEVSAGENSSA